MNPSNQDLHDQLERIEAKLDNHLERIAKVETSTGYIKWVLSFMISGLGASLLALKDYLLMK